MQKREMIYITGCLLVVAGLYLVMSNQRFYFLQGASAGDILLSRALASGQGFREVFRLGSPPCTVRPPGLTALLALISVVFSENIFVFKFINNLFGGAAFLGGALLLRKRMQAWAPGVMITFFSMTLPFWIGMAKHLYSGVLFTALLLWSLFLFEREQERGFKSLPAIVCFSVMASAAILTRAIGVTLPVTAVLAVIFSREVPVRRRLYISGTVVVITGLCFGGWTLRNYYAEAAKDQPYLSKLLVGEPLSSSYWLAEDQGIPLIPPPKRLTAKRFVKRLVDNGKHYLFHTPGFFVPALERLPPGVRAALAGLWFLAVIGGLGVLVFQQRRASEIYAGLTLLVALVWPFPHPRFLAPALPVLLLAMVIAITWLAGQTAKLLPSAPDTQRARVIALAAGLLFILANLGADAQIITERFRAPAYKLERKEMTIVAPRQQAYHSLLLLDLLRRRSLPDAKIMFHSVHPCGLVAERVCAPVPMARPETIMRWIYEHDIDYVIMDSEKDAVGASYFSYHYLWPTVKRYKGEKLILMKSYDVKQQQGAPPASLYKVEKLKPLPMLRKN